MYRVQRGGGRQRVDISAPIVPEVVSETDANPVSFFSGVGHAWSSTRQFAKYGE